MNQDVQGHLNRRGIVVLIGVLILAILIGIKVFNFDMKVSKKIERARNVIKISSIEDDEILKGFLREETKIEIEREPIPYGTISSGVKNTKDYITKIVSEGENGEKIIAYKVSYLDGTLVSKEVLSEVVDKEAKDQIVEKLARNAVNAYTSRGEYINRTDGAPKEYKKVLDMKATAYCLCTKCCGKSPTSSGYGMTASGLKIVPDTGMKVIAVDTSVIPLGTWVYVEGVNGVSDYGYAIAADTGSAIKGSKIDLYVESHAEAWQWGMKNVKVYIIE